MKHAERSAEIAASADRVFAFLSDIGNLPRWQTGVVQAEQTSPGPLAVGTTARIERRLAGQEVRADLRVTELEPNRRLVLATDASGLHVEASIGLEALGPDRCRVTFGMAMEATNLFMKAVEPMVAGAAEGDIGESLSRLQRAFD